MTDAIKEAGVRFVTKDSTTEGADRRYHYIHGMPVGPSRDAIAEMVLQDVKEKAMSLERIKLLPVQDAMVVLRKTASAALNYITRCGTPDDKCAPRQHSSTIKLRSSFVISRGFKRVSLLQQ